MFWRKLKWSAQQLQRLDALEALLRKAVADLEELEDAHQRLRGVVYARKIHKNPIKEPTEEPQEPTNGAAGAPGPNASRAELKAWLTRSGRFTPGKPPNHSE